MFVISMWQSGTRDRGGPSNVVPERVIKVTRTKRVKREKEGQEEHAYASWKKNVNYYAPFLTAQLPTAYIVPHRTNFHCLQNDICLTIAPFLDTDKEWVARLKIETNFPIFASSTLSFPFKSYNFQF